MMNTTSQSDKALNESQLRDLINTYGEDAVRAAKHLTGIGIAEDLEDVLVGYYLGCEDTFDEYFGQYFWNPANKLGGCIPDELRDFVDVKGYFKHLVATDEVVTIPINGKTHAFFWDCRGI